VLLILAMLMGLAAALTIAVTTDSGLLGGYSRSTTGFYAAESGLNVAMDTFRNKFLAFKVPSGADFSPQSFQLGKRTVAYQLQDPGGNPHSTQVPAGQLFSGLNSIEYTYIVQSQSLLNGTSEADVGAEFDVENIPIFQFVAFYNNDLEIMPGADMHLHGRVHTNGDLYLNSDAHLWIEDNQGSGVPASQKITFVQVTAKGDIWRGRKNDKSVCNGTVTVDKLQDIVPPTPDLDPKDVTCGSGASKVPTSTLALWKGSMVNNVKSINVPLPGIIERCVNPTSADDCRYWPSADLRIVLTVAGSTAGEYQIEAQKADGTQDTDQTAVLRAFMSSTAPTIAAAYGGPTTSDVNTIPIFVTDTPLSGKAGCNCTDAVFACDSQDQRCYGDAPTSWGNPAGTAIGPNTGTAGVNGGLICNNVYGTRPIAPIWTISGGTLIPNYGGTMSPSDPRRGGFYNHRENKWMILLNINLHDLLAWNRQRSANGQTTLFDPADKSDGGLVIFATVVGPESGQAANRYGVRIFGSANLPFPTPTDGDPSGVTLASDQAVYIVGDYNRGQVYTGDLVKQPAAVLADSLNLLSNCWFGGYCLSPFGPPNAGTCTNDCQSSLPFTDARRDANNPTTPSSYSSPVGGNPADIINAAFLSGVDTTTSGKYNGGLENYPRFHEDWGATTQYLSYHGSFVSLGTPHHVNGAWCGTGSGCGIYNPPKRNYDYDGDFNNVINLPPLTPNFVYVQQIVFTENFK
jgi:hypothetical protein